MYCRHCFRKRLVGMSDEEISKNFDSAVRYISQHTEISNVLISGGDSFMLSDTMIEKYLAAFTAMDHLDLIRFGTRIPVVLPDRVLKEPAAPGDSPNLRPEKADLYCHPFQPPQGS